MFGVTLARSSQAVDDLTPAPIPARSGDRLAGLRVLCVDNEADILTAMESLLTRWGCE
ncbi:hypothetical protein MBH78_22120 [Oceanimonas sp. NS1]|nr:hypothetical protein [Oceanimonas sp. NS1]